MPSFPAYAGHFKTSAEAKAFRSHARVGPKVGAEDVERVKKLGRSFWVRRLYEAMVDIGSIQDSARSVHRDRFENAKDFSGKELEACAHKIFDAAIAVHEVGWTRPRVYHKRVVRGKLADVGAKSLEVRLLRLCEALKGNKAMVDDAMRGGISLALLVDNPTARSNTKLSNNAGNKKRGERLQVAKRMETEAAQGAQQEEEEEEEEDVSQETVEDGE
ncbi:hypothetical protein IQ07DRAFT_496839 [Pyrenochaeta sp. DS3sAY3a]|nr:hypothetical protein IQ07DRAFT_496839 [Pyrenochaeta sp. DS3sAY3a]